MLPSVPAATAATRADSTAAADSVLAGAATTPSAQPSTQAVRHRERHPAQGQAAVTSRSRRTPDDASAADRSDPNPPVPDDSGDGRRVVFDQSDQRVWLVDEDEDVERTYLVSGSLYDNLDPGTYSVYSRSEQRLRRRRLRDDAVLRPLHGGHQGAAIGFHDIPIDDGAPVQTVDELGTPQSHGCIRQETRRRHRAVGVRAGRHRGRRTV